MPHDYSIEIHEFLNKKVAFLEKEKMRNSEKKDSSTKATYLAGQYAEIIWLRSYFKENTDLKNNKYY